MGIVLDDLNQRIEEGKIWLESKVNLELEGPKVRDYPTTMRFESIDIKNRVEQYGFVFLVTINTPKGVYSVQLCIRLKPKTDKDAYVIIYLINQETKKEDPDSMTWEKLQSNMADYSIDKWCEHWLKKALLKKKGQNKLFIDAYKIK